MQVTTVLLERLYHFAAEDSAACALEGKSKVGKSYGRIAKDLVGQVPREQGFYLWGCYEKTGLWSNIYLGKANRGDASNLYMRILEELKDEKHFLWSKWLAPDVILETHLRYFPNDPGGVGTRHVQRSLKKARATHVIAVATPHLDAADILKVERDLIETMNPSANINRPKPLSGLLGETVSIISQFKEQIHAHRP